MIGLFLFIRKDTKIENQLKSFLDIAQDLEDSTAMDHIQQESGLSFDPGYYKAKKDVSEVGGRED